MRRRCSPQAVHGSRPQGQNRTTSRHVPRCSGSQLDCGARILEEPARIKHTPRRADEHALFEKEVECNIAPVCRPAMISFNGARCDYSGRSGGTSGFVNCSIAQTVARFHSTCPLSDPLSGTPIFGSETSAKTTSVARLD